MERRSETTLYADSAAAEREAWPYPQRTRSRTAPEFPGCSPFTLKHEDLDTWDGRFEYWEGEDAVFVLLRTGDASAPLTVAVDVSEAGRGGMLEAASAEVTRLRLGLEGTRAFGTEGGGTLTPSFGLGVRHDGGDAETGFGAADDAPEHGVGLRATIRW